MDEEHAQNSDTVRDKLEMNQKKDQIVVRKNLNALMASSVFLNRSFAMDLRPMEIVVGGPIVRMVLTKLLKRVAKQESILQSFALVLRKHVNLMSGNATMGNVLMKLIVAMDLLNLAQLLGNLTARMHPMRTFLPAVVLLVGVIQEVKETQLVNADDLYGDMMFSVIF